MIEIIDIICKKNLYFFFLKSQKKVRNKEVLFLLKFKVENMENVTNEFSRIVK